MMCLCLSPRVYQTPCQYFKQLSPFITEVNRNNDNPDDSIAVSLRYQLSKYFFYQKVLTYSSYPYRFVVSLINVHNSWTRTMYYIANIPTFAIVVDQYGSKWHRSAKDNFRIHSTWPSFGRALTSKYN